MLPIMVYGKEEAGAVAFTVFRQSTSYVLELYLMCSGFVSHADISGGQQNHDSRITDTSTAHFYHINKS